MFKFRFSNLKLVFIYGVVYCIFIVFIEYDVCLKKIVGPTFSPAHEADKEGGG